MVVADWMVLCLKQKEKEKYAAPLLETDSFKIGKISELYYGDKWSLLRSFKGYGYNIYPVNSSGGYDYRRGFFDLCMQNGEKHFVLSDLKAEEFAEIIRFYIGRSPIKKIGVLVRLDWGEENLLVGTIPEETFFEKLQRGELLFNVLYIVGNP